MSPEELERRRHVVGASEAGLLFGLPSFGGRTVSDLWFAKKYGTTQSKGNEATALGLQLEPVILDAAEKQLGVKIVDRQKWITLGCNGATLDGRVENDGPVVEAKTSGIVGPSQLSAWGDAMTDDVPENYLVQCQAQLLVTGAELAYLAALIGGRGFAMFTIRPHAELMAAIQSKSAEFVESLAGDTPPAEPPQLDTLKRLRRQPNKILPQCDEIDQLWEQYEAANAAAKTTEKAKETIQRQILAKLQDAEAIECRGGRITYFEQSRAGHVAQPSTFRVMRFAKGK